MDRSRYRTAPTPRRMRMIASAVAVSAAFIVLTAGVAYPVVEIEPVVTGQGIDWSASANDSYVVFTRWKRSTGNVAYARSLATGETTTLNAEGRRGITGGIDPGTNRVIYAQFSRRTGSDLFFYDLDTGDRSRISEVSTRLWEFSARISSSFITFGNDRWRGDVWYSRLFMYNRSTGELRRIGVWKEPPVFENGAVGERYATYTFCNRSNCFAYVYDWETDTSAKIPSADGRPQYAPVVDEVNSQVYFVRSGFRCGQQVGMWRLPIDLQGEPTLIVDLPGGIDTGWMNSLTANGVTGQMDVYIQRWDCADETGDIYVARGVDAA